MDRLKPWLTPDPEPRCPTCGFVMCEQFDEKKISDLVTVVTPNGTYICYHCKDKGAQHEAVRPE